MISIVVQYIGIALFMISIVYDKHSCAMHWDCYAYKNSCAMQ